MRKPVVLIVGEGGATVQRLDTHLRRGGLRVRRTADCGGAFEVFMTSMGDAGRPAVEAVVLDVERAGFGAQEFRAMLRQEHPNIRVLDLPPDSAGPEDVGLLARALLDGLRPRRDETAVEGATAPDEAYEPTPQVYTFEDFNSRSPKMRALFDLIPRVARTDSAILVRGETGTGKELVAAAIHRQSKRRDGEFFTVNCGAMTDTLLESELFGHERGAFTGAVRTKRGYFELASGGTLFLDELGTISTAMQVRLLRVLETMEVRRVGGERSHSVNVRIVAATNESLEEAVRAGTFRKDLYYRLNVVTVRIPPLRDRPEDIPLLAELFIEKYANAAGRRDISGVAPHAAATLKEHTWPGNVRELQHVIERAVILSKGPQITQEDLPERLQNASPRRTAVPSFNVDEPLTVVVGRMRSAVEREYLRRVLKRYRGHLGQVARHAGVNRRTLYNKMQALELRREDFR